MRKLKDCPYCGSEVYEDNSVFVAEKLRAAIDWDYLDSDGVYGYPVGHTFMLTGLGDVEVVDKKVKYADVDLYYGYELPQGTEFDVYVVFKHNNNYYRASGTGDSYSNLTWHKTIAPVKAKTKTVTVYEFE